MAANNNQLTEWLVALSPLGNVYCISILTKLFVHLNNPLANNRSLSTIFRCKNIYYFFESAWLLIRAAFKSIDTYLYTWVERGAMRAKCLVITCHRKVNR